VWLRELRPEQWVKNAIVFAALVFGLRLLDPEAVLRSLAAFAVFCAASSSVYLVNDVFDRERDRLHPLKRMRGVASGRISVPAALLAGVVLGVSALAGGFATSTGLGVVVALYLALNAAYSAVLKHVVMVDVIGIALFFVLRAVAGAAAIPVEISPWLVVCAFMVMLFVALGKRRAELAALEDALRHRPASRGYTLELLDQLMTVVVSATIVSYCLYTLSPEVREKFAVNHLEATVPFVLYGLFRYLWLVRNTELAANPSRAVLVDGPLLGTILLWGATVVALIYAGPARLG
jgi:4-hydroxybenzoate polyprenyltransferase